jgi:hypothetical protein
MTGIDIPTAETSKLVAYFSELALARFNAERRGDIESYNQYFDILSAVEEELKARSGDQRTALVPLLGHANPQVRLDAAEATLKVAHASARQALQGLWNERIFPQAAYAMGTLHALQRGERVPT